jgi:hypothetical protein
MSAEGAGMGTDGERLPDDFSYEDFLDALDRGSTAPVPDPDDPGDADLATDGDGCVELATVRMADLPGILARLQEAGIAPHVEMPGDEPFEEATASVFVRWEVLAEARRIGGLAT